MSSLPLEADDSADVGASSDMGTSALPGRNVLEMSVVRTLSQRSDARGLLRFGVHLLWLGATGTLVWLARPWWCLFVPAMALHGFGIVTMFAPMHECVHRTAFKSKRLNEIFGWIAGLLCFYNSTFYRRYHTWHHRYTQDAERDPELSTPKPKTFFQYLVHVSGIPFWINRPRDFLMLAMGRMEKMPYIPAEARRETALSVAAQLGVYGLAIVGSIVFRNMFLLYYWFVPALLAEPFLRLMLIVEHTGCTDDTNGLTNTRTTLTMAPVRLLMWNMPFHAEHHLYPSIPFHQLPLAHERIRASLAHIAPSYVAANQTVIHSLGGSPTTSVH